MWSYGRTVWADRADGRRGGWGLWLAGTDESMIPCYSERPGVLSREHVTLFHVGKRGRARAIG
ncbi:MAG: hypothetical protein Ct9H300mP12_16350 [Acidimicrobiales bacterium]|nr:MAG: hypothetical protein Ct9H300mP12_16350 [Acidimicrobiales bacterium]